MKKLIFILTIFASCNGGTEKFQFEEFLTRDLEKMAAEGKIKYEKSRKYTIGYILYPEGRVKITDEDYKILMRSYNFRHALTKSFSELGFRPENEMQAYTLTGKYAKIWHIWGLFGIEPYKNPTTDSTDAIIVKDDPLLE